MSNIEVVLYAGVNEVYEKNAFKNVIGSITSVFTSRGPVEGIILSAVVCSKSACEGCSARVVLSVPPRALIDLADPKLN